MIALVLNYLCDPSGKPLPMALPSGIQILHFYILITSRLPYSVQRKTSFLDFIRSILLRNHRIIHDNIHEDDVHYYNPLIHTDHICSHADTAVTIGI